MTDGRTYRRTDHYYRKASLLKNLTEESYPISHRICFLVVHVTFFEKNKKKNFILKNPSMKMIIIETIIMVLYNGFLKHRKPKMLLDSFQH